MIAHGAARYLHLSIFSVVAVGLCESIKHYLQSKGIVNPPTAVAVLGVFLAPLLNWLLIFRLGLGLDGAVWAMNICQLAMLAGLATYTAWHHRRLAGSEKQTWHGWSGEALQGWGTFLKLGVPSTVMVCLEW